jgi:hypothetical protein
MAKNYFKMTGKHPIAGPDTRYLVTESIDEFECWVKNFKDCGFVDVHTSVITDRDYSDAAAAEESAAVFMFRAYNYIMNKAEEFGDNAIAMYDVKDSKTFSQYVLSKVSELPDKYRSLKGKATADALHEIFLEWAYNY